MEKLAGKTAVVTGAASGMGLAMARRFAREEMNVAVSYTHLTLPTIYSV